MTELKPRDRGTVYLSDNANPHMLTRYSGSIEVMRVDSLVENGGSALVVLIDNEKSARFIPFELVHMIELEKTHEV